jgi:hypothetical protein
MKNGFVVFVGRDKADDQVTVVRSGLSVSRGRVVDQMARHGVCGDVLVTYHRNGEKEPYRTVRCGI